MAYEDRQNGTHAMTCDTPGCSHECLSPGKKELIEDLNLSGWVAMGKNQAGDECFACPHCTRGVHPGQAALNRATGGTGEIQVHAPMSVSKGDEFHDENGDLVGHYTGDADQGDPVGVKVQLPEPPKPPDMIETYDAMMEGSDADDDKHGRVSAVAPAVASADGAPGPVVADAPASVEAAPVPRSMGAAAGADGSGGVVRPAGRPDLTSTEAKERLQGAPTTPRGPKLDTAALDRTAALFDNLDPSTSDWDPDDD